MFSKLIVVALISVAVAAPQHQHHTASQFPAGVDPLKCPSFPICDNAVLHNQQPATQYEQPQQQWNQQPQQQQWNQQPQQQWNQPKPQQQQWNQPQPQQQQWNQPQPQQQWNQPQPQQQQWNKPQQAAYQAPSNHLSSDEINGAGGDKFPAGVDPKSCPNYPYCDGAASHDAAPATASPPAGYNERQYPAGVSPHSCPNFPYCS